MWWFRAQQGRASGSWRFANSCPGLRGIDGGPLANARIAESITALLIGLNIRYRVSGGTGIRFTGLPDSDS